MPCPYESLEVEPGASQEEIRKAYERIRAIFGPSSLALYSLTDPEEQRRVLHEIEAAYRLLSDPEARRAFDESRGHPNPEPGPEEARRPEDMAAPEDSKAPLRSAAAVDDEPRERAEVRRPTSAPQVPPPLPKGLVGTPGATAPKPAAQEVQLPPIGPDTVFTGELLRKVRLARGMELRAIADRTKISPTHLESIEQERWDWLPERVFLRGFLISYARELKLDPRQVSESFLSRRPQG